MFSELCRDNRVHTGHEKPEKQFTFVKSHGKSHENFKKLTKVMKVVMKKKKNLLLAQFFKKFILNKLYFFLLSLLLFFYIVLNIIFLSGNSNYHLYRQ